MGQWPRRRAATWKGAAPWKAINSFRVASLSLGSLGPAWHSPLCSPCSHLQSSGCAVGKKEAITQMSATQRGIGDRRGLGGKEGRKGGDLMEGKRRRRGTTENNNNTDEGREGEKEGMKEGRKESREVCLSASGDT